jgi:hypothetical protein
MACCARRRNFLLVVVLGAAVLVAAGATVNYVPLFDFDGNLVISGATVKLEHQDNLTGQWRAYNASVLEWYLITMASEAVQKTYRPSPIMDIYYDFTDEAGDGVFTRQVELAVPNKKNLGPAYPLWKEHVVRGVPFSMLTARGHDAENIRNGMDRMIQLTLAPSEYAALLKNFVATTLPQFGYNLAYGWWGEYMAVPENVYRTYLRSCNFWGVGNPWLEHRLPCSPTSACKALVVKRSVEHALAFTSGTTVVSFYDDELPNIEAVKAMMKQYLAPAYPAICFRVYDTTNLAGAAVQNDLSAACAAIPPGDDWQSQSFLHSTRGSRVFDFSRP